MHIIQIFVAVDYQCYILTLIWYNLKCKADLSSKLKNIVNGMHFICVIMWLHIKVKALLIYYTLKYNTKETNGIFCNCVTALHSFLLLYHSHLKHLETTVVNW